MTFDITRAWKDEDYRNSLSDEQLAQLPENPAGEIELSDEDLGKIAGGRMPTSQYSACINGGCNTALSLC